MTQIIFIDGSIAEVTYAAAADNGGTNSTSHSVSIGIGAEPSVDEIRRIVVVAVQLVSAGVTAVTAATIGGITASIGTAPGSATDGSTRVTTVFVWAEVPTGTSATVALTLSSSALLRMRSFRVVKANTSIATHENGAGVSASGTPTISTTLNVLEYGVAIAVCHGLRGGSLGNWAITAGVTEDFSGDNVGGATTYVVGGSLDITADETGRTISASLGGSGVNVATAAMAAISFR